MQKFKKPLLFALALLPVGLLAGWLTAEYLISGLDESILKQAIEQVGSRQNLILISTLQVALYALFCGFFGYILAGKTGLFRPIRFSKPETLRVMLLSVGLGILLSADAFTFARWIPELAPNESQNGPIAWLAALLYGGVIEEIMMRLFLLSLFTLVFWKIFFRAEEKAPEKAQIIANILTAILFAALHLPATLAILGRLTPLLIFRCFLFNGLFGLFFGRFYRKYGIQYAILSHMLTHLVSRTVFLFL